MTCSPFTLTAAALALTLAGCVVPTDDDDATAEALGPAAECLSGDLGFGTEVGDCAQDFALQDSDGVTWTLHEQAGNVILLDLSAFW